MIVLNALNSTGNVASQTWHLTINIDTETVSPQRMPGLQEEGQHFDQIKAEKF